MFDPRATWPLVGATALNTRDLLLHHILPFASITATAVTLGVLAFNRDWNFDFGYNIAPERAWRVDRRHLDGGGAGALSCGYGEVEAGDSTSRDQARLD
jgi:hypothetical protein